MKTIQELEQQSERIEEILGMKNPVTDEEERAEAFTRAIKKLRAIQHELEDVAKTAALELNRVRSRYNYWLEAYKPFLKQYALEHAKVDKDGVKAKNYRDIASGGGVFFTAKTSKTKFDSTRLMALADILEEAEAGSWSGETPEDFDTQFTMRNIFKKVEVVEVLDADKLVAALQALKLQPEAFGIELGTSDPIGHMYIGTERGWTPNKVKEQLSKALEGELPNAEV